MSEEIRWAGFSGRDDKEGSGIFLGVIPLGTKGGSMFFIDKEKLTETEYISLLFLLNAAQEEGFSARADTLIKAMVPVIGRPEAINSISTLGDHSLVYFTDKNQERSYELDTKGYIGLSWYGLAFLINYANEFLEEINRRHHDLPEGLIATLIPYLDLANVPAADRHVKTTDNLPEFQKLARELEIIRHELIKDQNKNELPIPDKKSVLSDIDATLAQIKDGAVRLSDLTSRIRPLVRNLADWCKDIGIIAGAATAAYLAIERILATIF